MASSSSPDNVRRRQRRMTTRPYDDDVRRRRSGRRRSRRRHRTTTTTPYGVLVLRSLLHPKSRNHRRELRPINAARMPNLLADYSFLSTPSSLNVIPPTPPLLFIIAGRMVSLAVWPQRRALRGQPSHIPLTLARLHRLHRLHRLTTMTEMMWMNCRVALVVGAGARDRYDERHPLQ